MVHGLTQNLNSPTEALNLFIGDLDWTEPKYHQHWDKLEELKKSGFFNDDVASQELYQGIQLFDTGKASMCFNTGPALPNSQKKLGADKVGFMVMPVFGTGSLAGVPIPDSQGFGIPCEGQESRAGGEVARVHALARAGRGDVDALQADPGEHRLRQRHDRRAAAQDGPREVDRGRPRRSTSPT